MIDLNLTSISKRDARILRVMNSFTPTPISKGAAIALITTATAAAIGAAVIETCSHGGGFYGAALGATAGGLGAICYGVKEIVLQKMVPPEFELDVNTRPEIIKKSLAEIATALCCIAGAQVYLNYATSEPEAARPEPTYVVPNAIKAFFEG